MRDAFGEKLCPHLSKNHIWTIEGRFGRNVTWILLFKIILIVVSTSNLISENRVLHAKKEAFVS